jgi:CelD/BcsL family acetyltransferase involved in cellulose biosynthesis
MPGTCRQPLRRPRAAAPAARRVVLLRDRTPRMRRVATLPGRAREAAAGRLRPLSARATIQDGGGDLLVEPVASFEDVRADWSRLGDAAGSPFGTWEWGAAWWEAFGGGAELLLHVLRRPGGEVAAVLPLYLALRRGPFRVARFIGHGPGDQLGPICTPADRAAVAGALNRFARSRLGLGGVLLAERLPAEEGWSQALGGRLLRRESSPLLEIGGRTWDEWLASRSRNFREQVRRRERKLLREHEVTIRLSTERDEVAAAFDTLVRLHEARWAGASRAFAGARLAFHRDFVRRAADRGWARIWLLEVDGRPGAAWYGLRFGDADWYYQAGRDPEMERANVGFVLLSHTIRDAFAAGRRQYRFLLGDEPYKSRFMTDDPGLDTVALSAGPGAAGAAVAAAAAVRLPRDARQKLLRRVG